MWARSTKNCGALSGSLCMEFSGVLTNVMNHLDFANYNLGLQSTSNWGTTKTQGNNPSQI